MKSRLLAKLDSEIAIRTAGEERDALIAERASYLARLGDIRGARQELVALRERVPGGSSARISILSHIADGLCHYYTDMGPEATDRFKRAHALAQAAGLEDLVARASSWLALVHYGEYEFVGMVKRIDQVFSSRISDGEVGAFARASLIIAQTVHLANKFDLALPWYRRTKLLSAKTEDEATISALMHNMASIWATNARNAALGGPATSDNSRQALAGALSTLHFDDLVGLSTLSVFTPLLQAQIHSIEGDFEQALALYERYLGDLHLKAAKGWQVWLLADKARCQLELGRLVEAQHALKVVRDLANGSMHVDDLAAVVAILEKARDKLGVEVPDPSSGLSASELWEKFTELQKSMLTLVGASEGVNWMSRQ